MENRIIKSYMEDFQKDYGLSATKNESDDFEKFVNYCIVSRIQPDAFSSDFEKIETMNIGGGGDTGIDGIAVIVNDRFVSNIEEIEDIKKYSGGIEVKFIFIQSKISPKFESDKIGNFIFGVKDFFKPISQIKFNEHIRNFKEIKDFLYSKSIDFKSNPVCQMYYITTGKWTNDTNVLGVVNSGKTELKQTGNFRDVIFDCIDADKLANIYKEIKNKVQKEIVFEKRAVLPSINGIDQAYIGILPITEYIKLISDSDGNMQKNLFYDNVRDFLGTNPVNNEIKETLMDINLQNKFGILNNGVTIVAKTLNPTGDKFTISDFQIVNGCQTSHIIFKCKNSLKESIYSD